MPFLHQGFVSFGIFGLDEHLIILPFKKRWISHVCVINLLFIYYLFWMWFHQLLCVFVGWLLCVVSVRMKASSLLLFLRKYDWPVHSLWDTTKISAFRMLFAKEGELCVCSHILYMVRNEIIYHFRECQCSVVFLSIDVHIVGQAFSIVPLRFLFIFTYIF